MLFRILVRLRPLVRPWAIAVWAVLVWAWSVLAEVHLAAFVYELGGEVSHIVHTYPGIILVSALLIVVAIAVWPEIRHLIPQFPETIHQRVQAMYVVVTAWQEHLKTLVSRIDGIEGDTVKTNSNVDLVLRKLDVCDARMTSLESWFRPLMAQVHDIGEFNKRQMEAIAKRLDNCDSRIIGIDMRVEEHRAWLSDLRNTLIKIDDLANRTSGNLQPVIEATGHITVLRSGIVDLTRRVSELEQWHGSFMPPSGTP